jgi:ubiquinone/menaquinone biosynthesis C-methylase UbiE
MADQSSYERLERFSNVDASQAQAMFFAFLDRVEQIPDVVARRHRTYGLLGLQPGWLVADVGCGLGTSVREIAELVGPTGASRGFDMSEAMVSEARRRVGQASPNVQIDVATAEALPLEVASLDAYRAERLYQHLDKPMLALQEARRVLKPGARLVLVDQDWDTAFLHGSNLRASRIIHAAFTDSLVNGTIGRQFRHLLLDAGFSNVQVVGETIASANADEYGFVVDIVAKSALAQGVDPVVVADWMTDQQVRIRDDRFFMSMTLYVATAQRP